MYINKILYVTGILLFFSCKETARPKSQPEPSGLSHKPEKALTEKQTKAMQNDKSARLSVQKTATYINWDGKYSGSFLRLKDETADPRAWGQIGLSVNGKNAMFSIDSYVENIYKNLEVIRESGNELKLKEASSDKTLTVSQKSGKIIMEGDLMESIVGITEQYEIEKATK